MKELKRPELLSPAGNFEKMEAAIRFGADAVYLAGQMFGMRSAADNFTVDELRRAAEYVHEKGKKLYLTVNTMPREYEYPALEEYMKSIAGIPLDALIIADLGVMELAKRLLPDIPIHVSTQAGVVSSASALIWRSMGAERAVLARELNFDEIREIARNTKGKIDLEIFIHGSMCVSWSGRCLLSNHFTGRDGNRGMCAQPCRWNYTIYEEKRPETGLGIEQDNLGTFIMSSKDLCMLEHIPELVACGAASFKIEGRMKSAYYTAVVTNAYRMALHRYFADPEHYSFDPAWLNEAESVSHREYATGYFFDEVTENAQTVKNPGYLREKAYLATVSSYDPETHRAELLQRNKLYADSDAELLTPGKPGIPVHLGKMWNENGEEIESAPHPYMRFFCEMPIPVKPGDILRGC